MPESQSAAAEYFRSHPDIEDKIRGSPQFADWREQFTELKIDNELYYVRKGTPMVTGGDTFMDEYEMMLEWARQAGVHIPK